MSRKFIMKFNKFLLNTKGISMKKKKDEIQWSTEIRNLADLKEHPKNPRDFTSKGMADLGKSLKNLGYIDLIAINTDGTVIGGHARRRKLIEQGKTTCEVRVPDRLLSEEQVEEALIRLNKNIAGEFSILKLGQFEQQDLIEYGFEKSDFNHFPAAGDKKQATDTKGFFVMLEFASEKEQEAFYNEMNTRGLICKLMS